MSVVRVSDTKTADGVTFSVLPLATVGEGTTEVPSLMMWIDDDTLAPAVVNLAKPLPVQLTTDQVDALGAAVETALAGGIAVDIGSQLLSVLAEVTTTITGGAGAVGLPSIPDADDITATVFVDSGSVRVSRIGTTTADATHGSIHNAGTSFDLPLKTQLPAVSVYSADGASLTVTYTVVA